MLRYRYANTQLAQQSLPLGVQTTFLGQVQALSHGGGSPTQSRAICVTKIQINRDCSERLNELLRQLMTKTIE